MFQFHIGSISGFTCQVRTRRQIPFQFHIGSISGLITTTAEPPFFSFNSTLVRFQDNCFLYCDIWVTCFNSTLVRFQDAKLQNAIKNTKFQFHIGSISGLESTYATDDDKVSIPHWFDFRPILFAIPRRLK